MRAKREGVRLSNSNKERRRMREREKTGPTESVGGKNGEDRNRQKVKRWKEMELFEERRCQGGSPASGARPPPPGN